MSEQSKHPKAIQVMIVDDSALVRQVFIKLFAEEPDIEVLATASDPFVAAEKLKEQLPDVLILDIEMPRMDGLTFLHKIMTQRPIPVIICSSLVQNGSDTMFQALENGAIEIIPKPEIGTQAHYEEMRVRICDSVRAASITQATNVGRFSFRPTPKYTADVILEKPDRHFLSSTTDQIVAIGASTGGTEAIAKILQELPGNAPGIVIVQHMPSYFTRLFADRLNSICRLQVKEAEGGETILRGQALIAPGNRHLAIKRNGARYVTEIIDGPLVNRHRPAVDVLFRSVARHAGKNALGILLTGMGDDGAQGLLEMKNSGSYTIAQDEHSAIVFGMPGAAIQLEAANSIEALDNIPGSILSRTKTA